MWFGVRIIVESLWSDGKIETQFIRMYLFESENNRSANLLSVLAFHSFTLILN
jgi:hypothetical protein